MGGGSGTKYRSLRVWRGPGIGLLSRAGFIALGPPSVGGGKTEGCVWVCPLASWGQAGPLACQLPGPAQIPKQPGRVERASCLPAHPLICWLTGASPRARRRGSGWWPVWGWAREAGQVARPCTSHCLSLCPPPVVVVGRKKTSRSSPWLLVALKYSTTFSLFICHVPQVGLGGERERVSQALGPLFRVWDSLTHSGVSFDNWDWHCIKELEDALWEVWQPKVHFCINVSWCGSSSFIKQVICAPHRCLKASRKRNLLMTLYRWLAMTHCLRSTALSVVLQKLH